MKLTGRCTSILTKQVFLFLIGFIAVLWFLVRVIPKPSRATYPCQQAAFPLASAFIVWLTGSFLSSLLLRKTLCSFSRGAFQIGFICLGATCIVTGIWLFPISSPTAAADTTTEMPARINDFAADSSVVMPRSLVSIVRSSKANAADIDSTEIQFMVRQAIDEAGGFGSLIKDSSVVVLKPNLIAVAQLDDNYYPTATVLPEKANAVTTDYRIVQAVVTLVREHNPHGRIFLTEGSGIGSTRDNLQKMGMMKIVGLDSIICLDEACGAWRDKSSPLLKRVSLPPGKALYTAASNVYYLNKTYYEADVLISLPVLKTHCNAAMTGAVKNVGIGATPVNIYGASTGRPWRVDVIDHGGTNYINLHHWIHDFYMCRPVDFAVMDALTGMENGPTPVRSDPVSLRRKNTRCIIASKDPIALDAIASLIVQVDPLRVQHLTTLHNDSLGCVDPTYIRVRGIRVDEVKDHYSNVGAYASYSDFTPPAVSVNDYKLQSDTLVLHLNASVETVKLEVAIDGVPLDRIYTKSFSDLKIFVGPGITDPSRITLFLYDRYLNCSTVRLTATGIRKPEIPSTQELMQNYPNPFNPTTTIEYYIPSRTTGNTTIKVYDMRGMEVATLVNEQKEPGRYKVRFDALNISSGVYFYKLQTGYGKDVKKLILIK